MSRLLTRFAGAAAVALLAAACDSTPVDLPLETDLVLGTEAVTLHVGGRTMLSAQVVDQKGLALRDAMVQWVSSNAAVVAVDWDGEIRAIAEGTAEIIASYGSLEKAIAVTVVREDRIFVKAVEFLQSSGTYHLDRGQIQLGFRLFDGHGELQACAAAQYQPVSATSSDESVVRVNPIPNVTQCRLDLTPASPGTATVTLTVNGVSATHEVTVTSGENQLIWLADNPTSGRAGDTLTVRTKVVDVNGDPVAGITVNFDPQSFGSLLNASAITGTDGIAAARWVIPTDLRHFGSGHRPIRVAADLGNGNTATQFRSVSIAGGAPTSLKFFRWDYTPGSGGYVEISGDTLTHRTGEGKMIVVNAYDRFGNLVTVAPDLSDEGTNVLTSTSSTQFFDYKLFSTSGVAFVYSTTEQTGKLTATVFLPGGDELTKTLTLDFVNP